MAPVLHGARIKHTQLPKAAARQHLPASLPSLLDEDGWAGGENFGLQLSHLGPVFKTRGWPQPLCAALGAAQE